MNNEWIPCSERMPEKGEKVLACSEILGIMFVARISDFERCMFTDVHLGHRLKCSHWMPLPEPPKKKLKPCPFCGSEAVELTGYSDKWFDVSCTNLHCSAHKVACHFESKEKAVEAWERRCDS